MWRLRVPKIALTESGAPAAKLVRVRVEAPDLCHRFTARVVSGVTVGPSPLWSILVPTVSVPPVTAVPAG